MIPNTIQSLTKHYWGNIVPLALLLILILFGVIPAPADAPTVSVTLERYAIMIPIIVIPLALRHFARQIKKASRPLEATAATGLYKRASLLRLYSISTVTLIQIVLFGYSRNMNFFWLTIVLFTVFLFCKPSRDELTEMTEEPLS